MTAKEMVIAAQNEEKTKLAKHRVGLLASHRDLKQLGGKDDYSFSLEYIVRNGGPDGVTLSEVRTLLPDAPALGKAVKHLLASSTITESESGRTRTLRPASAPQPVQQAAPQQVAQPAQNTEQGLSASVINPQQQPQAQVAG